MTPSPIIASALAVASQAIPLAGVEGWPTQGSWFLLLAQLPIPILGALQFLGLVKLRMEDCNNLFFKFAFLPAAVMTSIGLITEGYPLMRRHAVILFLEPEL